MPRSGLPQNYILKAGTLFENFENITSWTKGGTDPIGTVTSDTTNVRFDSAAVRLTVNTVGSNVSAIRTINQLFTDSTIFHLWVYMPDWVPAANWDQLEIVISSYTNYAQYFRKNITTSAKSFVRGWNHFVIHASEFVNSGSESWTRTMVRTYFRAYCKTVGAGYITLDNMFYAQESMPRCVITFDDTFDSIYSVAFAKMNPLGLRGTVYITKNVITSGTGICGPALTVDHINEIYEAGWAVANHTVSHPNLSTLTQAQIEDELMGCYEWLVSNGWTRTAKHVAYPYGQPLTAAMIAACEATGMITGRTTFTELEGVPAGNIYELKSEQLGETTTLATVQGWVNSAIRNQMTINLFGHALADGQTNPDYWGATKFNSLIDYLVACKIRCVTIDEWYEGLTNPRYRSLPVPRISK